MRPSGHPRGGSPPTKAPGGYANSETLNADVAFPEIGVARGRRGVAQILSREKQENNFKTKGEGMAEITHGDVTSSTVKLTRESLTPHSLL